MPGILLPHPNLRRGGIIRSTRMLSRSGIITRDDETDPLAGIPFSLRLQTHGGEVSGVIHSLLVSGAGDDSVNGLYYMDGSFDGRTSFSHTSGDSHIIWFSGWAPVPVWLLNTTSGPAYINLNNTDLPPEEEWQDAGGGGPAPFITVIEHKRLAPLGLYKDTTCTIPATNEGDLIAGWRDEISGSGLVAVQDVSTKRPSLRFVAGRPVVRFDGVDDVLQTTIQAPDDAFSYAASGGFRGTGIYPALIGSPPDGVTLGGYNGDNRIGINRLGVNGPQTPIDVGTGPFTFVATYEPYFYSYHVRRPFVPDVILTNQTDASAGYSATGNLMIGNGHNEEIAAPVDLTSILILSGARWTAAEMALTASHLYTLF